MYKYAVIGLGRFGSSVAQALIQQGHEVLHIDNNEDKIQQVLNQEFVTQAICVDATVLSSVEELGIDELDAVVLAIGENLQDSMLTALNLLELDVKRLIAKAITEEHGKILRRLGVHEIVYPERDMGARLALKMSNNTILDGFDLDPRYAIREVQSGQELISKSLRHLDLRAKYGIHVMALRNSGETLAIVPDPDTYIQEGDSLLVIGDKDKINAFIEDQT